jgi:DNA-3-methyladenine glycosylase II
LEEAPLPKDIEAIAARWRPYCTVASWYLWRSLDTEAAI